MKPPLLVSTLVLLWVVVLPSFPVDATRTKKLKLDDERARYASNQRNSDEESLHMVNFYNATNGPEWIHQWGWLNSSIPHCDWEGVGCNNESSVTSLELPANALTGNVTDLSSLSNLVTLDLAKNKLHGSLEMIGVHKLKALKHLKLGYNSLSLSLPDTMSSSLAHFDLSNNHFEGTINANMLSNLTMLQYFDLSGNKLNGKLPNLGSLSLLKVLDVSVNGALEGTMNSSGIFNLTHLETLHLSENDFEGGINSIANLTNLTSLDLSGNEFDGSIHSIANVTNLTSINLAHNLFNGTLANMTGLIHLQTLDLSDNGDLQGPIHTLDTLLNLTELILAGNKFNGTLNLGALTLLQTLDVHDNFFSGDLSSVSLLSNLEALHVANNRFNGTLPPLGALSLLQYLNVSSNALIGSIPNLSSMSLLRWLDVSHQYKSRIDRNGTRITQGLSGNIPQSIGQLGALQEVYMQSNLLSGEVPDDMSRLAFLSILNLESNLLSGTIPPSLDLLEQLHTVSLAKNQLVGPFPELGGSEDVIRTVRLKGNAELQAPAPFALCDLDDLDIREDNSYCPMDRQALVAFYQATKGADWNVDTNWLDPNMHHCTWFGVLCDETNTTILSLELSRNGLAGAIPSDLFILTSLQSIDFNDNELHGFVPSELGMLTQLTKLRLSYNELTGLPTTFGSLTELSFLHLHGNRISGDDSFITVNGAGASEEEHAFISDCGDPVDSDEPFQCDGCDMCCNSLEECQVPVQEALDGYNGWVTALIIAAAVIAFLLVSGGIIHVFVTKGKMSPSETDAREACGDESVYSFVLSNSWPAWIVLAVTLFVQLSIFALFLNASIFDHELSDWIYSWRCPKNSETCSDENNVSVYGWVVWALLVFTAVLEDIVNGLKLINLAASRKSAKVFLASAILLSITFLAIWTSAAYNRAIAMSSTELIVNAVILLFVNDIDEQIYSTVKAVNPKWVERIDAQADELSARLVDETMSKEENVKSTLEEFYPAETWESNKDLQQSSMQQQPEGEA